MMGGWPVIFWAVVGVAVGRAALWLLGPLLGHDGLQRSNYRGHRLPTAAGLVCVLAAVAVAATVRVLVEIHPEPPDRLVRSAIGSDAVLMVMLGFGLLGLLDDVFGVGEHGGFRRHLRALGAGRPTTGAVKLLVGGLVAVVAVVGVRPAPGGVVAGAVMLFIDAALVALAANTANLFDRAPGRALKVVLPLGGVALMATRSNQLDLAAVALGAALALLADDLGERAMLGDTGVNPLGALVGLLVVAGSTPGVRVAAFVALIGINLLAERISFSAVIRSTPWLHRLDVLGAPHRAAGGEGPPPPGALP